jgi:hypothetical protein
MRKFDMLDLFNLHWWRRLWFDEMDYPAEVFTAKSDDLFPEAGTRGVLVIGDPGTGKALSKNKLNSVMCHVA